MPHFGLMEEKKLGPVAGPLQRARLHIRGGKRRLRQGKISAGIITLYDALSAAMEFHAATEAGKTSGPFTGGQKAEKEYYSTLVRSGVLNGLFDFDAFDRLTETALHQELDGYEYQGMVKQIETVMEQLGVMPFNESDLPGEDPSTY